MFIANKTHIRIQQDLGSRGCRTLAAHQRLCAERGLQSNWLDWFRLGFALLVMFSHSYVLTQGPIAADPLLRLSQGQKTLGSLAVDGFFIISGFLIVRSWLHSSSMQDFLRKRVLRIHPGYAAASCFSLGLALLGSAEPLHYLYEIPWRQFLVGLFSLGYGALDVPGAFVGNPYGGVNASLWTIQIEFWAYLGVAAYGLFGLFRIRTLWILLALSVLLVYLAKIFFRGGDADAWWRFGCMFVAGASVYLLRDLIPRSRVLLTLTLIALTAGIAVRPWFNALLPIAAPYALFYVALRPTPPWASMTKRCDLSYGLYLFAYPVQQAFVYFFGIRTPLVLFLCSAPVVLLCATASWFYIESRFLKWKSGAFPDWDPNVPPRGNTALEAV